MLGVDVAVGVEQRHVGKSLDDAEVFDQTKHAARFAGALLVAQHVDAVDAGEHGGRAIGRRVIDDEDALGRNSCGDHAADAACDQGLLVHRGDDNGRSVRTWWPPSRRSIEALPIHMS